MILLASEYSMVWVVLIPASLEAGVRSQGL